MIEHVCKNQSHSSYISEYGPTSSLGGRDLCYFDVPWSYHIYRFLNLQDVKGKISSYLEIARKLSFCALMYLIKNDDHINAFLM